MNSPENKVFGCRDIRSCIFEYLPKRCKSCKQQMSINNNWREFDYMSEYKNYDWRKSECPKLKGYCNWCYYYVFEYR